MAQTLVLEERFSPKEKGILEVFASWKNLIKGLSESLIEKASDCGSCSQGGCSACSGCNGNYSEAPVVSGNYKLSAIYDSGSCSGCESCGGCT